MSSEMNERNQRVMRGRNTDSGELSSNNVCDHLHMTRAKLCYTFVQAVWFLSRGTE